ncbi:response regulator [Paenibacillus woosongensis]|uniref:Response regulator n=1 Tax=Paenibacillus woosongensis TaxID=307580 RepID=A0AA95IBV6_9BACL|nr:response regulator [Paenibacillus woosongensis]WHX50327.1 response regulator [Paenibacillus woosongensis]
MLRLVIVDDESSIREGAAKIITKENEAFVVAGVFSNGQDALDFIETTDIDVVITDIRMPLVDGLELIKRLKSLQPEIRCIIMSGFTDFEYARQALRCSAVDYLLKPINKKQLFKLLNTLHEEKEASLGKEQRLRSGVLLSYFSSPSSFCSKLPELHLPQPYFVVYVLRSRDIEALHERLLSAIADADLGDAVDIVETDDGMLALVSYYTDEPDAKVIRQLAGQLQPVLAHLGIIQAGSSRGYSQASQLSEAYRQAVRACDYGLYDYKAWCYYHHDDLPQPDPDFTDWFISIREELSEHMQILNIPLVQADLEKLFGQAKEAKASRQSILSLCRLIHNTALAELPEWKSASPPAAEEQLKGRMLSCLSFAELKSLFFSHFLKGLEMIRATRLQMADKSVETVKRWIQEHYDQQTELGSLASMVYLTPSYLSKLFKNETGMTITDYLIEVRIKKAKHLLKTSPDMKIHEIGCGVGYPDPAYFNKLFKRIVGVTPNEYKKINAV